MRRIIGEGLKPIVKSSGRYDKGRFANPPDIKQLTKPKCGAVLLCQEHKMNVLSPKFLSVVQAGIGFFESRTDTEIVMFGTEKSKQFISTVDYHYISKLVEKNNPDSKRALGDYFLNAYSLALKCARYNRPLVTVASGSIESFGAAILAHSSFPMCFDNTIATFPEASIYGFVPLGGITYDLSRLPNELGTCFALTGLPLNCLDLIDLNMVDKMVVEGKTTPDDFLSSMSKGARFVPSFSSKLLEPPKYNDALPLSEKVDEHLYRTPNLDPTDDLSKFPILNVKTGYKVFFTGRCGNADPLYMFLPGIVVRGKFNYEEHIGVIRRCFYPNDVEEIMQLLKSDPSQFAKDCLAKMETASPLALKLTLKLLREARKGGLVEASMNEIAVAYHRCIDKEFPIALEQRILTQYPILDKNIWKYNSFSEIPDSQIQSYFERPEWLSPRAVGTVENAFLPNREFRAVFPECMRMWLNHEGNMNPSVRESFSKILPEQLKFYGLDLKERGLTTQFLRSEFSRQMDEVRYTDELIKRASELMQDPVILDRYISQRKALIDKFCESDRTFYPEINKRIEKVFEQLYMEKMQIMAEASHNVNKIEKHRFIYRLKHFLLENRVLIYINDHLEKTVAKIMGIGPRVPYIPTYNDVSFLERPNPAIKSTFTYYIAKALKRDQHISSKLLTYLIYEKDPHKFIKYMFNTAALEELKKRVETDPKFVSELKRFYTFRKKKETKGILEIQVELCKLLGADTFSFEQQPEYVAYLKMKGKINELDLTIKEDLVSHLENLIGKEKRRQLLATTERQKSPATTSKTDIPNPNSTSWLKEIPDVVNDYLKAETERFPYYNILEEDKYISYTKELIKRIMSQIMEYEIQTKKLSTFFFPNDMDGNNALDNYFIKEGGGKAVLSAMSNKVLPLFYCLFGPLARNELERMENIFIAIDNEMVLFKEYNAQDVIPKMMQHIADLETIVNNPYSNKSLNVRKITSFPSERQFMSPSKFAEHLAHTANYSSADPPQIEKIKAVYSNAYNYLKYLRGINAKIKQEYFLQAEILDDVAEKIKTVVSKDLSSKEIRQAIEIFSSAWNHRFSYYGKNAKVSSIPLMSEKEAKEKLQKNLYFPSISFLNEAVEFPNLLDKVGLSADLSKDTDSLFFPEEMWKLVNLQELAKTLQIDPKLLLTTNADTISIETLRHSLKEKHSKDSRLLKLVDAFFNLLSFQVKSKDKQERREKTLLDVTQGQHAMSFEVVDTLLRAINVQPNDGGEIQCSESEIIGEVLKPPTEAIAMINYYRSMLEKLMLSGIDEQKVSSLINDYVSNRTKYVQLHPLFSELQKHEDLYGEFSKKFTETLKEELQLGGDNAPDAYKIAIKHLLKKPITGFEEEDKKLSEMKFVEYEKYFKKINWQYDIMDVRAKLPRRHQATEQAIKKDIYNGSGFSHIKNKKGKSDFVPDLFSPESIQREKQDAKMWNPKVDKLVALPNDPSEEKLKEYYNERKDIIRSAKELQGFLVAKIDPSNQDPSRGFGRILGVHKLKQCPPTLPDYEIQHFYELDALASQALYSSSYIWKARGLSSPVKIPDAFEKCDIRYSAAVWFEEALTKILRTIFLGRLSAEPYLDDDLLKAYDYTLLPYLEREKIKEILEGEIKSDVHFCSRVHAQHEAAMETKGNEQAKAAKSNLFRKEKAAEKLIRNKDLLVQKVAYDMALWRKTKLVEKRPATPFEQKYGDLLSYEASKGSPTKI